MAAVYYKDIASISLAIGGVNISEGGGESDFLKITTPERGGATGGVHGDISFHRMPNSRFEVSITTLETSAVNQDLQKLAENQWNGTVKSSYTFSFEDVGTGETLEGEVIFAKDPDRNKTAETQSYEWTLIVGSETGIRYRTRAATV